jgi:4-amino-4-deoxy-L-arabinose transferase-like glycosyltransferase
MSLAPKNWLRSRAAIALLFLTLLGGGIRLFVLEQTYPIGLVGDEVHYMRVAGNLATGFGAHSNPNWRVWRPPGHPFVISLLFEDGADGAQNLHRVLGLQVVLGTLIVLLTALLGEALFDFRTGLVAGLIAALYPNFVAFSTYLWSENLYTVFLLGGLLTAVRSQHSLGFGLPVVAGVIFGLGALTREASLLAAGASAFFWIATAGSDARYRQVARGAVMLGVALLCVLPWTARNHALYGRLIPVSTIGWFAAGEGNTFEEASWLDVDGPRNDAFRNRYLGTRNEMDRMDFARRYTLEQIAAEQPTWIFKKAVRSPVQLFNPYSSILHKIHHGAYGEVSRASLYGVAVVSMLPYLAVFLLGTLGIAAARGDGRLLLPCVLLGVFVSMHILANADVRFRLPWIPIFIIYTSHALLGGRRLVASMGVSRRIALAGVWLFFLGLCIPYGGEHLRTLFP